MLSAPDPFGNLFETVPDTLDEEQFEILLETESMRIERIVSTGQASPPGDWFDQAWDEWVLLLKGAARLVFEGEDTPRPLSPGDYLLIPAHVRHRVDWTDPDRATVWLAVHFKPQPS